MTRVSTLRPARATLATVPVPSEDLIGRDRELQLLEAALDAARTGEGSGWLVQGAAGMGKSRLVEELARRADRRGFLTLRGRCWEAGGAPAFWPWLVVLRDLLLGEAPIVEPPASRLQVLGTIVPELDTRYGPLPEPVGLEPAQARFRLLDAVAETLVDAARTRPLLVILEDLHVADSPSLVLLELVLSQVSRAGLAVVGTHREADDPEAARLLERIGHRGNRLTLARLTPTEVERFLERAPELSPALAHKLHALTAGNPLFLVEMAALLRRAGGTLASGAMLPLPTGLRGAIEARLGTLSPATRETLRIASVLGREIDLTCLCDALGLEHRAVDAAVAEAGAANLVELRSSGCFRFSHGLVQEALHQQLEASHREELHMRVARWLEKRPGSPGWSELAHHYGQAGPDALELARDAAIAAAETAMTQHAHGEAARQLARAITLHGRTTDPDPRERSRLLRLQGAALLRDLQVEAGREACREAARVAREIGDAELLARAVLELGEVYVFAAVDPSLVQWLRDALEALGTTPSPTRPRIMARLAAALQPARDPTGPIELASRAIELARESGDERLLLDTLRPAVSAMMDLTPPDRRRPHNLEHLRIAETFGDRVEMWRASLRLTLDEAEAGDRVAFDRHLASAQTLAEELDHPAYAWPVVGLRAARAAVDGDSAATWRLAEETARLCELSRDPNALSPGVQRLALSRVLLHDDRVLEILDELEPRLRSTAMSMVIDVTRAAARARLDPTDERAHLPGESLTWAVAMGDVPSLAAVAEAIGPRAAEVDAGPIDGALRKKPGRFGSWGMWGMAIEPPAIYWAGSLALARGDLEQAIPDLESGLALVESFGHRPGEAMAASALALALERRGSPPDLGRAAELRARAGELVERHGLGALPVLPGARAPLERREPIRDVVTIERDGESWVVSSGARTLRLGSTKGIAMLARLVAEPGREIHVLDLSGASDADRGDAGELLDDQARQSYRQRVRELRQEMEEAEAWNDPARLERAREELRTIEAELARAVGLGGRSRRAGSAAERARVNVQRRIKDALKRIQAQDDALGRRLAHDVSTGIYCRYDPA